MERHRAATPIARRPVRASPFCAAPGVVCRADGDRYLLVEYGPNVLDLNLRFRVHALEAATARRRSCPASSTSLPASARCTSTTTPRRLDRETLLDALDACERAHPRSRRHRRPLAHRPPAALLGRPGDPARHPQVHAVRAARRALVPQQHRVHPPHQRPRFRSTTCSRIVFDASYLVLGLGDVYLGAPVATPVDPRHRLVTTKYNPARTWTPENAVGIGGAYLCVYGMEGPGGYQFVGPHAADVEHASTRGSTRPWLLRFFDQIRFYPVSAAELLEIREAFPHGGYPLRIEDRFRLGLPRVPRSVTAALQAPPAGRSKPSANVPGRFRAVAPRCRKRRARRTAAGRVSEDGERVEQQ